MSDVKEEKVMAPPAPQTGNGYGIAVNDLKGHVELEEAMLIRFTNIPIDASMTDS